MKKPKKKYSEKTKRQATQYPGVCQRQSKKTHGKLDTCYDIFYKEKDGKKVWEKIGWASDGYSAKLASIVRADRIRRLQHGEELPGNSPKAPLFSNVAEEYLQWAKDNKSRGGIDDKSRYENHLKAPLGNKRLDEISSFDLEKLKIKLSKKGLSPATVKHCLVLVRMIVNKAIAWALWKGENPVRKVKLPNLQNERQGYLSYEKADQLLKALKEVSPITHDIALISLHCGLRLSEITALRGIDVDFNNGTLNIANPKNKAARQAYMTETVEQALRQRIPTNPEGLLFTDRRHKGRITSVSHSFDKVVDELGFNRGITDPRQKIVFHSLRHTHASWLAMSGESLLTIQQSLGHKDLQMVKRYAHLGSDTRKQAAQRLEEAFNKAGKDDVIIPLKR